MNETQTAQQNTQNVQSQLDPNVLSLTKAIALQENGGRTPTQQDYLNQGQTGERGLYQFTKPTWNKYAGEVLGNPNADPTPENQNQVAYGKVKQWLDKGYKPEQIASMWNAGEGAPDAYAKGLTGTTSTGARYDVGQYTNGVMNYYHQNLQGENQKEEPSSFLGKLIDFAFPIVSDVGDIAKGKSKKSSLQLLGDLGLSALWFIPGIGEATGAAIKGAGLLGETGARVAGHVIGGAVGGYGADVASKLAEGQTDAGSVLTPGFGTVTGGLLGGALGKLGTKYSEANVLSDITNSNNSILGQTKRGATELAESFAKGKNTGELLASKGINLASHVNPETVAFDTLDRASSLRTDAGNLNSVLSEALQQIPGTQSIDDLEKQVIDKVSGFYKDKVSASEAANIIQNEFNNIRAQYGTNLTASDINELKQRAWGLSKFDMATPNQTRLAYRNIGNTLKTTVENMADSAGVPGVGDFNEYIGSHLDAADALERLNGTKAKGGRLGDMLQKHTLGLIGAGAGGIFGGGIIGSILGAMAGEYAGGKIGALTRKIMSSPLKNTILQNMAKEDPEVVQKIIQYARQQNPELADLSRQLKLMGAGDILQPKVLKGSPVLKPRARTPGVLPGLITTTGARLMTAQ